MSERPTQSEPLERTVVSRVEGQVRLQGVPQPDIADSFRRAKAALDAAARDIAAVRRRAGNFARRAR